MVFDASVRVWTRTFPMTVLSSMWRSAPALSVSVAAYATPQGEPASTMLLQIRTVAPIADRTGPVTTRCNATVAAGDGIMTLAAPGSAACPSEFKATPGTSVESQTNTLEASPVTLNWRESQTPFR